MSTKDYTLDQFIADLSELDDLIDGSSRYYNNNPKEIGPQQFTFEFDGYLLCEVRILHNGEVEEFVDGDPQAKYRSIDDWKQSQVRQSPSN